MLATIIISFIVKVPVTGEFINLSLFLAFAKLYPDMHPFDREEMMSNQVQLAKKLVISIEQKENEKS